MNKQTIVTTLKIIAIPIIFLLVLIIVTILSLRHIIRVPNWFDLMYYGFLLLVPLIVGILTVYLSSIEEVKKWQYRVTASWVIFLFFLIMLFLISNSWVFFLVFSPVFMILTSIGGLIGGNLKLREKIQTDEIDKANAENK